MIAYHKTVDFTEELANGCTLLQLLKKNIKNNKIVMLEDEQMCQKQLEYYVFLITNEGSLHFPRMHGCSNFSMETKLFAKGTRPQQKQAECHCA